MVPSMVNQPVDTVSPLSVEQTHARPDPEQSHMNVNSGLPNRSAWLGRHA